MRGLILLILGIVFGCSESNGPKERSDAQEDTVKNEHDTISTMAGELNFLALGDSYTIGESVSESERWPVQLVEQLDGELEEELGEPQIVAKTGWTTDELQTGIKNAELSPPYDLVSLLIGVNNQYRSYDITTYQKEFVQLVEQAIAFAGNDTSHVFVVSIPDYGVTPFAEEQGLNAEKIAQEIDKYNEIARNIAKEYEVKYFNIASISRKAENHPELIADDGLHPSGKMYSQWADLILPWAIQVLDE